MATQLKAAIDQIREAPEQLQAVADELKIPIEVLKVFLGNFKPDDVLVTTEPPVAPQVNQLIQEKTQFAPDELPLATEYGQLIEASEMKGMPITVKTETGEVSLFYKQSQWVESEILIEQFRQMCLKKDWLKDHFAQIKIDFRDHLPPYISLLDKNVPIWATESNKKLPHINYLTIDQWLDSVSDDRLAKIAQEYIDLDSTKKTLKDIKTLLRRELGYELAFEDDYDPDNDSAYDFTIESSHTPKNDKGEEEIKEYKEYIQKNEEIKQEKNIRANLKFFVTDFYKKTDSIDTNSFSSIMTVDEINTLIQLDLTPNLLKKFGTIEDSQIKVEQIRNIVEQFNPERLTEKQERKIADSVARRLKNQYNRYCALYGSDAVARTSFVIGSGVGQKTDRDENEKRPREFEVHIYQEPIRETLNQLIRKNVFISNLKKSDTVEELKKKAKDYIDTHRADLIRLYGEYETGVYCGVVPDQGLQGDEMVDLGVLFSRNFGFVEKENGGKTEKKLVIFDFGLPLFDAGLSQDQITELREYISEIRKKGSDVVKWEEQADGTKKSSFTDEYKEKLSQAVQGSLEMGQMPEISGNYIGWSNIPTLKKNLKKNTYLQHAARRDMTLKSLTTEIVSLIEQHALVGIYKDHQNRDHAINDLRRFRALLDIPENYQERNNEHGS